MSSSNCCLVSSRSTLGAFIHRPLINSNFFEAPATSESAAISQYDTELLQVLIRQVTQNVGIDRVFAEVGLVPAKAKALEPVSDSPWSRAAIGHGA
jgi:hypothetical protein